MASLRTKGIRALMGAAFVAVGAYLAQPQQASALEILPHAGAPDAVNAILLKGDIVDGDTFDLQVHLSTLPKKDRIIVYLDSPGGKLYEGMRLGKFFFENKIETVVEAKTRCTSACALAFLGGRDSETGKPHRTKYSTAALGFHAFARPFEKEKQYSATDMQGAVQYAQTTIFAVADYLKSIEANLQVLHTMLRAPSNQMNFVTNDDAIGLGILVYDEKKNRLIDPDVIFNRLDRSKVARIGGPAS